jgi:hypothetical protein
MTAEDFKNACDLCCISPQRIAELCDYHRNNGTAWAAGKIAVPAEVGRWLTAMAEWWERNPPPPRE